VAKFISRRNEQLENALPMVVFASEPVVQGGACFEVPLLPAGKTKLIGDM